MRLLIDLDDTLVDRDGAFRRWAEQAVADAGGDADDLTWLLEADAHGYTPRARLAAGLRDRLGLGTGIDELVDRLLTEHVEHVGRDGHISHGPRR